jgi:hypothetical protein
MGVVADRKQGGGRALQTGHRSNVDSLDLGEQPWQFKGEKDYIFVTKP